MATTVSSLSPYQFAFNGFLFGAGTKYAVTNVDGLMTTPDIRVQDDIRGYNDGSYSGRDFYNGRTVTIDLIITGDSVYNAQYYYNQLQSNLYPQQLGTPSALGAFQFEITSSIGLKIMYGRVRKVDATIDPEFTFGYIVASVEFFFPDPRYYDFPSSTASGSSVSLTNNGWAISCPVITISSAPSLFTISDGTISMSFAPTSGTTVVIDLLQKTITQNGTPNRSILTTSNGWLSLAPISTNTWTITSGSMSISYSDAYV
jgi:hypothetical protein